MTTKEQLIQELENAPEELLESALKFILTAKENFNQTPTTNQITSEQTDMSVNGIQAMLDLLDSMPLTPEEIALLPQDGAENHDHYLYGAPKKS